MADKATSIGIGVLGLLGVAFVILKLTHVINWSWWWVTCPFWAGLAIFLAAALIFLLGLGIAVLIDLHNRKNRQKARLSK